MSMRGPTTKVSRQPGATISQLSGKSLWVLLIAGALLGLAALSLFQVHQPPLQDYANHLARIHILLNSSLKLSVI
jgi:hypothetical protein